MLNHSLAGLRVIELGTMLAAPFATHIMSQMGAEVIKIEPPRGDPTRSLVRGGPSGTFIAYSHGKKSVCIDLKHEGGYTAFCELLKTADILVHNLAPGAARKLGVSNDDCKRINPDLVYCHIRGYAAGPQENDLASNPVAEAATGVMEANIVDGRPSRLGPSYHDQFAGVYAVVGILAELLKKKEGKNAEPVEVGLYETGLHVASRDLVGVQLKTQLLGRPEREPHGEFSMPGYGAYRTADDRWLYLLMLTDGHWQKFCEAMELPEAHDSSLVTLRDRKKRHGEVNTIVKDAIRSHTFNNAVALLNAAGVGCTEVLPIERVLDTEQARYPGKLRTVTLRGLEFSVPEFPRHDSTIDDSATLSPPELGEHTLELLLASGMDPEKCKKLLGSGAIRSVNPEDFTWAPVRQKA